MKPNIDDTVTMGYVPYLALFVFSACVYSQPSQPMPTHRPGQAIVSFDEAYPIAHCRRVLQAHGCQVKAQCRSGHVYQVMVDPSMPTLSVVDALNNEPSVVYAELNYRAHAHFLPNDPFFGFQWHLRDPNEGGINMPKAWDRQQGDPNVIIAVLDTGVAYDDHCIAVGASTLDRIRAYYSNTGDYVDLVAPGGEVITDLNEDGFADGILQQTFFSEPTSFTYGFFQGTSMAAPHVAGAAALLISDGVHHPQAVRTALEQTALDLGAEGPDLEFGWGLIDVAKALRYWDDVIMPEDEGSQ